MQGVGLAHISAPLSGTAREAVVGAHKDTVLGILQVETHVGVVAGLEVSAIAKCVDDAEVSLHSHGAGQRVEEAGEIVDGTADLERLCHNVPLAVPGLDALWQDVVRGSVHDGETGLVHAHPRLAVLQVIGVEKAHVA